MPAPSNLQALPKDISSESLRSLMRAYSGQLGIGCGYCHAPSASGHGLDFASDAKREKVIARAMILMTADINAKYLAAALPNEKPMTVDCGTCHRGHAEPEPFVPPPHEGH
ncbi:MAG: c-type cytochrome [Acidobacteriota bacterium]|nr:c-type cytochrome [Acidobacteriota bacterium]